MAGRRDLEPDEARDRLARVAPDRGYRLGDGYTFADVLAVEAELLRSEGIDQAWPGFDPGREAAPPTREPTLAAAEGSAARQRPQPGGSPR